MIFKVLTKEGHIIYNDHMCTPDHGQVAEECKEVRSNIQVLYQDKKVFPVQDIQHPHFQQQL